MFGFDDDYEIPEPDHYTFVYEEPDNGWWLKIDSIEKLGDYHVKTASLYNDCIVDYLNNKDNRHFTNTRTVAIEMYASRKNISFLDAVTQFRLNVFSQQCDDIREHGYIVINRAGGYHSGPTKYSQFVNRKTFIWPDFKSDDIKISQFPGGIHWYVRIGDMELHEGDNIKWNTYEEANNAAQRYVNKEK